MTHITEAAAIEQGYTVAVIVSFQGEEVDLLVKPGTDLDGQFDAFCPDYEELISVKGWFCTVVS